MDSSNNNNEEDKHEAQSILEHEKNALIFDNICHNQQESCFTKLSENLNLDGFKNFIYLIVLISCGRLMFENYNSYGFSANPFRWVEYVVMNPLSRPTFFLFLLIHFFIMGSLILENCYVSFLYGNQRANRLANGTTKFETNESGEKLFRYIYTTWLGSMMSLPFIINQLFQCNPYLLSFVCLIYSATFLKLYSYHQVNSWWRTNKMYGRTREQIPNLERVEAKVANYIENIIKPNYTKPKKRKFSLNRVDDNEGPLLYYPQNLSIQNIYYFFYAPTLCYQLNYPRTKSINFYFVARCALEFLFLIELETVLFEQWIIVPLSQNHFILSEMTFSEFLLRWSKMSLGTISIWLIGFYSLFQSLCNLTAEILQFADRDFYGDWWNAKTIGEFWRLWNLPVHRWCVRHIFKPLLIEKGYSRITVAFIIFFISGIFHEYLFAIPMNILTFHFVIGMTAQMVVELATSHIHKTNVRLANSIVWLSLIFGQSLLILLYYNDLIIKLRREAALDVIDIKKRLL
ncbi:hypothetical protein RDWZM_006415 [Blomia tropicalis]|uniref:O-acyltransferase n=1 Tax=Blomia tropicalis TaxID=40697 RepID=A0A9Q0M8E9_BLOTA|nr:hypothetical protein RDWZM_006415 [Blomia tropicalis]